ncbi:MAG: serine/threonine protein kinase [Deltaproteobacteria bacterium]|nr:serine/threonine protein kinase [Deltaproteobacteria bacterium]
MPEAIRLGRYQLLNQIAFGGMAEIYRAKTFTEDGRAVDVAIKRVLSHLVEDEAFILMLADEARIAGLLHHKGIAQVYEFCRVGDECFIAMEYVDGKDVRTILEKCRAEGRWFPSEMAALIMIQALEGLHAAHELTDEHGQSLHLIHRDVSPSNILCSYDGNVKLCDFGIAKATLSRVKTRAGIIKGKVKYMSPEQALGRKLDQRSDLFSAGSVLYEMLTRVPPFLAKNEIQLILKVREAKYVPIRERNPAIPPALEVIVDRAMSRSRSKRFQTALEFADALRTFISEHARGLNESHLSRYLKNMFRNEIEEEHQTAAAYDLDIQGALDVGVNLIADALGPQAVFSAFTALPTGSHITEAADVPARPSSRSVKKPRTPRAASRQPGGKQGYRERTTVPDRHDEAPLPDSPQRSPRENAQSHRQYAPRIAVDHEAETVLLHLSDLIEQANQVEQQQGSQAGEKRPSFRSANIGAPAPMPAPTFDPPPPPPPLPPEGPASPSGPVIPRGLATAPSSAHPDFGPLPDTNRDAVEPALPPPPPPPNTSFGRAASAGPTTTPSPAHRDFGPLPDTNRDPAGPPPPPVQAGGASVRRGPVEHRKFFDDRDDLHEMPTYILRLGESGVAELLNPDQQTQAPSESESLDDPDDTETGRLRRKDLGQRKP